MTYTYTYDDNGNILTISDGTDTTSYVYDSQNQLIRENNQEQGYTYTWEYSEAGNIVDQMHYDYLDSDEYENYNSIAHYTYDDEWGDVLLGVGSETYTVDAIGNRTSRRYGTSSYVTTYTWEHGRQLASVGNWQYKYNNDGMLIEQRNGNDVYTYVYNGTQLSQMSYVGSWEEYTMHFTYDANGTPMTVTFDYVCYMDDRTYDAASGAFLEDAEIGYTISDTYYYITNIQGDVIELLNSDGESAGYYRYDAWGDDIDMWDQEDIIYYNPLRYRGYIYDRVSGYYYLQTRFYDPEVGRFINADSLMAGASESVQGHNLFAYCFNNPVNLDDENGNWPFFAVAAAACAVLGAIVGGIKAANAGKSVLKGALVGAAVGGLVGAGLGATAGVLLAGSAVATTTAVASGAGMMATAVSTGGAGAGIALIADNISRSANNVGTVLYSGGEQAAQAATTFANNTGGTTIDTTVMGQVANAATSVPGTDFTTVWSQASAAFCSQASGVVNAFVSNSAYRGVDSIFWSVEIPALLNNPRVTEIVIHIFE